MFGYAYENDIVKWEITACCLALLRSEGDKRPLIDLTAAGSHALLKLGGVLTSAGKRLSGSRTSGKTAAA
jgi:hypothetical protein